MKRLVVFAALAATMAATAASGLKTPETSRLFLRHVDPSSGVESWVLKPGIFSFHQQGYYFTQRSMTDDGRFLLFWARDSEYEPDGKTIKAKRRQTTAMIDFATDTIIDLKGVRPRVAFVDVKTDQIWYFNKVTDSPESFVCRRDLLIDPLMEIKLCRVPEALIRGAKKIWSFSNHPTLTKDRKKMFISAHLDDRFEYGCINLETGAWERWGIAPFYANHDQLNPMRDDLAMVAWEKCKKSPEGIEYMKKTGWYPRMWHVRPDGSRELQPSRIPDHNSATHEHWSEDGKGFYWCAGGVHYQDLATGAQETVSPWHAAHAAMSSDNRFVTFDSAIDKWYRGCQWQVGFWNRDADRGVYIHAFRPALSDDDGGWHDHPDPHPSFVCNDRYVLCTMNGYDRRMNLSLTPVAPLVARTAIDPDSFFANLPAAARPEAVLKRLEKHGLARPADDCRRTYCAAGTSAEFRRAAHEMSLHIKERQIKDGPAEGLFHHAPDVPFVWGRGAGWMAAGMALLLTEVSPWTWKGNWHEIMEGYSRMMAALLKHQRADGLWGQLVNDPGSWDEMSGSAMYVYAFVEGVRRGWLDPAKYGPAARKAYLALVGKLEAYANLKDSHGPAAMSWICRALMEPPPPGAKALPKVPPRKKMTIRP